jgi:hypothetical protein
MHMNKEQIGHYKGYGIYLFQVGDKYQIGIGKSRGNNNGLVVMLKNGIYKDLNVALTSGVEYANGEIDKLILKIKRS